MIRQNDVYHNISAICINSAPLLMSYRADNDDDDSLVVLPHRRGSADQRWVVYEDRIQTEEDFELVVSTSATRQTAAGGKGQPTNLTDAPCRVVHYTGSDEQHWTIEHR